MLTPGPRNEFIDFLQAKMRIAVLPRMDVKTQWNSTLELLERAYWLREFTCKSLRNPKSSDYWPLFTTQNEWTIIKYVMEVLRQFWYWMLWMSKRHTVTPHHILTVYNDMLPHMDGVMWAVAKKMTQWKEDFIFAVKFGRQKLSNYYTEVTPVTSMLVISAHILDPFWKFRSYRSWDMGMCNNPEDERSYNTQHHQAILKYAEYEYCAKRRRLPVIQHESVPTNNLFSSAMATTSGQSSYDPCDLSIDDEDYLMPKHVAKSTPRQSDDAARLLTVARRNLNSPPEWPQNGGQINPNHKDYHSHPMEISSTILIPDIADWWRQEEEVHLKYTNLPNVVHNIFFIIPHWVGVDARFSLWWDVIGWTQSRTTVKTLRRNDIVRLFAGVNNGLLAGDDLALDTTITANDSEMKGEVEQKKLHRMAKVHDFMEMWRGSQNLRVMQRESRA